MSRPLAFRSAALAVPLLLAAAVAGAGGFDTPSMPAAVVAAGEVAQCSPTACDLASVEPPTLEVEPHGGPATGGSLLRVAAGILLPGSLAPVGHAGDPAPVAISISKPLHLADFLLQTHTAFHLASAVPAAPRPDDRVSGARVPTRG